MPRVLIIIPNLGRGGAQKVFHQQRNYLSQHFEVVGCVFNWDGAFPEDRLPNMYSLQVPGGTSIFSKFLNFCKRVYRLRKLKKEHRIDVSISHLEGADYVNILSKTNEKIICWIHGSKKHDGNINGLMGAIRMHLLIPVLYKRADHVVAVSKGLASEFGTLIPQRRNRISTIYNGFDLASITQLSNQPIDHEFNQAFDGSRIIITHCRLSAQKNLVALMRIFRLLMKERNLKLVIIGDGELRQMLLTECERLDFKTWTCWYSSPISSTFDVYFLGQQQNPFKFLKRATLYLMPSGWEGFPLALCEAMACKLPVIVSDCFTGPREIVAPDVSAPQPIVNPLKTKYGLLLPLVNERNDSDLKLWGGEISKFIAEQHDHPLDAEKGPERIREFDMKLVMKQTVELISDVLK